MSLRAVLITGAAGGIGAGLVSAYRAAGYCVIATGRRAPASHDAHRFLEWDLEALASDDANLAAFRSAVQEALGGDALSVLVNNAATQILGPTASIRLEDWNRSLRVNVTAPLRLVQAFLPDLERNSGMVLNIGSVHARATKREFVSYATSKTAMHGLTRALAVDLGPRVRVLCLAPAAVETPMLRAGFEGKPEAFAALAAAHPVGRIATPDEIGRAAVALSADPFLFASGAEFYLDGGVLSRLYDPQ
jgi:NAD(P)-dependent dehydrogenase (short-subunit alcohol dehydrogenase family)